MKKLQKLKVACDILLELGEDAQCIAVLDWKRIPEAAVHTSTYVSMYGRVTQYTLNSTRIVDIQGYGYFQIL